MPTFCSPKKSKRRGVCAGDLNRRIKLNQRTLDAPQTGVDYGHTFTSTDTYASVETVGDKEIFGGTNMDERITHIFIIRYRDITAEWWITYRDVLYDIVGTEDLDERGEYLALKCNVRGSNLQPVNEA